MPLVGGSFMPVITGSSASGNNTQNSGVGTNYADPDYNEIWDTGNVASNWLYDLDVQGHNEKVVERDYNAREAEKQRQYEMYLSNTAMQRKAADYAAAGFSPLAALDGSQGASTPSGVAASTSGNVGGSHNGFGGLITGMLAALAMIASKGISAATSSATASAKAASNTSNALAKIASNEKIAVMKDASYREAHKLSLGDILAGHIEDEVEEVVTDEMVNEALERLYGKKKA